MTSTASAAFWQTKRQARATDATARGHPNRMSTSAILNPPKSTVNFEVETFRLYGKLKKTTTEIHNSLPSSETIETEKTLMSFNEKRHVTPDTANYDEFYRVLASSVTPYTARTDSVRSSRSMDAQQSTFFTLAPLATSSRQSSRPTDSRQSSRPPDTRQSIFSRLGTTSYGVRPLDSRGSDRHVLSDGKSLKSSHSSKLTDIGGMNSD